MWRRKTNEPSTDKYRNVMRKLVVERWVEKRSYDIEWSDEKKCRGCNKEESMGKAQAVPCRAKSSKENWKWQRCCISSHPLSGSSWRNSHLSVRRWRKDKEERVESGEDEEMLFLILFVIRYFRAVSPASDDVQHGEWKMEEPSGRRQCERQLG